MTLVNSAGDVLNKTELLAMAPAEPAEEAKYKLNDTVYETFPVSGEGSGNFQSGKRRKFKAGTVLTQSQVDALYTAATVDAISPASGAAAGGETVTLTGTHLAGVEGVTFAGNPATNVKVVNASKVTCTTPAGTAGAVNVVVQDDSGDVTKTGFYTYV